MQQHLKRVRTLIQKMNSSVEYKETDGFRIEVGFEPTTLLSSFLCCTFLQEDKTRFFCMHSWN